MKVSKAQALILLFDLLSHQKTMRKEDYISLVEINDQTFYRYLSEMRCYLANFRPEFELRYNRGDDTYSLISLVLGNN
jgi:hypothetical protein